MEVTTTTPTRNEDGALPSYAWPGSYPIIYLFADNSVCCPDCANNKNGSDAYVKGTRPAEDEDKQCELMYLEVYYEGPPLNCAHCGKEIESAYGDPDKTE